MATHDGDHRRQRIAAVLFVVLLVALSGAVLFAAFGSKGAPTAEPAAQPTASAQPAVVEHVLLVARETPGDAFTDPVGQDVEIEPLKAEGSTGIIDVDGAAVGLYGGTMDIGSCDRSQLADFLDAHPAKAQAWADVAGIDQVEIRSFIATLTPLVLRADTLVTNHGYYDGQATTFASVLEAGTAVLVDDRGLPRVRCFCGNPLTAAPELTAGAVYDGPEWKGFSPATTVRVRPSVDVIDGFQVVDAATDSLFTRPAASSGAQDAPSDLPVPAGIEGTPTDTGLAVTAPAPVVPAPTGPASAPVDTPQASPGGTGSSGSPDTTTPPTGEPVTLFEVTSIAGVSSGPPKQSRFTLDGTAYVTSIMTYHYLNEGSPPGTIALKSADGTLLGPWSATGSEGQGGVANAYWTVTPNVVVPAGTYTIVDSNPGTWSWAFDTKQRGITIVQGIEMLRAGDAPASPAAGSDAEPTSSAAPPDGAVDCTTYPQGSAMWTLCNHDPLNE